MGDISNVDADARTARATRTLEVQTRGRADAARDGRVIDACARSSARVTQESGVAASDVKKLEENGIHTVEGLAHASKKQLCAIKGL